MSWLPDDPLARAALLALVAGASIPLGGALAMVERIRPEWLERELRHSVIAFGGGALLAAVALVLVPDGLERLSPVPALLAFVVGGVLVMALDRAVAATGGTKGQFLAMLLDFVPESVALGAAIAVDGGSAMLLALLIALQNLPEAFNAFRETAAQEGARPRRMLRVFAGLALLGPLFAALGATVFADVDPALGALLLGCAGGILYLVFQDVAPAVPLRRSWAPPLGAVLGFALGLAGHALLQG